MKILPPTEHSVVLAARVLREGGLIIMPTETVYGIACDATNPQAVKRIFEAKARPHSNPLIAHVASIGDGISLASDWNDSAARLASAFWPGPLTLVVKRTLMIAPEATAQLDTVAIRMPSHSLARAIIEGAGVPLAAPSANRYMSLSPTCVEHLDPVLLDAVELVIDGGPCEVGIESSVVDVSSGVPKLLRPGGVSRLQIESAIGMSLADADLDAPKRSPGMNRRHYAPKSPLRIVEKLSVLQSGLTFGEPQSPSQIRMPTGSAGYASALYDALQRVDRLNPTAIYVEAPPKALEWEAVWDRLKRASEQE